MKVLFDVNTPRPLRQELPGHEVITAQAMGWGELENGDLSDAAEKVGRGYPYNITHTEITCLYSR
jgi:hypothetical protein